MKLLGTYTAINGQSSAVIIKVYQGHENELFAKSFKLGTGHNFAAETFTPLQVASELAHRHGYSILKEEI